MDILLALISLPIIYFLTLAMLGAFITNAGALKICLSVDVTILIFIAITAP